MDEITKRAANRALSYQTSASSSPRPGSTVAILAPSDLEMFTCLFALSRMGYTVMLLSPRLAAEACVSLLDKVECTTIFHAETVHIHSTMQGIQRIKRIPYHPIPSMEVISRIDAAAILGESYRDPGQTAIIVHSSGSTGTPKPLFLSHRALMTVPLKGSGLTVFNPLPWFHLYGIVTTFQAFWKRKTCFAWNARLPMTGPGLISALQASSPESMRTVPYILQLLADAEGGIEVLKPCKSIVVGGAQCPDELGDKLASQGVRIGVSFGS